MGRLIKATYQAGVIAALVLVKVNAHAAEDTIYLEETVISGNQELPKVLYILPWRQMSETGLPIRQLDDPTASVLSPVYPDDYRRELNYRAQLKQHNTSTVSE